MKIKSLRSNKASLVILFGLSVLVLACARSSQQAPVSHEASYEIVGENTYWASVTYANESGGTQQENNVALPWVKYFTARPGDLLYISVQNRKEYGSVTTRIFVDGKLRKTSTSEGAYVIATSSYRCCE